MFRTDRVRSWTWGERSLSSICSPSCCLLAGSLQVGVVVNSQTARSRLIGRNEGLRKYWDGADSRANHLQLTTARLCRCAFRLAHPALDVEMEPVPEWEWSFTVSPA